MDPVNWRTKFPAESREKVVNKIISSLMKRFPFSEHEKHMSDYKRIAVNFEEKVYMVARDQQDYIMRIKSRLESKNLNPGGKQGQSISVQATTLSQAHEQHSLPNVQDNNASGGVVTNLASARPPVSISPHVALPNNASENSNLQSVFGNSQRSVGNLSGCGQPFNISVNNLRQEQGRQNSPQIVSQQNHEQLNPHLYKQVKQENISPSYITQKQLQPQHHYQPKLLNPTQQHTSQQSMLQTPVMCPSETRVAQLSDIWQDQMSYFDQTTQSGNKTQSQIAFRQTNQSQVALDIHQNVSSSSQNPLMQSQKQVHLIGRKLTATNTQQSHLDGQPNGCPNLHQQQPRLPCQQNTVQQQFHVQKINHSSAHHEQLSERNNMYVLPQSSQLLETECASSGMRLCEVKMQGQTQQKASVLLPNQDQESQADSLERRLNSQIQPQKMEQLPDPSAQDQQQTYQTSGTLTSSSARRVSCTENWQEDAYQMLQSLKSKYLTPLTDMYNTITCRLQQLNSISQQTETGSIEKLNSLRNRVNTIISNLSFPKSNIPPSYKESLGLFEKYIISILSVRGRGNSAPSQQHGQQSSDVHSMRQFVQLRSQTSPVQTQQDEKKPTFQPVNSQDSATMQRSNATNLENDSKSVSEHPTLQPTEKYSGKIGSFNIVQQVSSGTLNIPRSNLQQPNIKALLSHSPVHGPQSNVNAFEPSCNTLQKMCLKQPKEERDVQTQTPKQELQDRHEMLHQSVQQKQIMQQHSGMVRLQSGASFPTDLPKTYGSSCSQVPRCPTIDKKNLPMPLTEARTTFYPINSRSTKTSCLVPLPSSSVPGDFERPISDTSSLSNAGDEQVNIAAKSPSPIAISTPGISVSPLLEESSNVIHCDTSTTMSDELSASEQPIQRLIKVVNLMSSKTLSASVLDIGSVVCTTDRISGSATLTGSGGSIGEDLAGMTNSRLQKSYLTWQGMTFGTKNMKRCRSTVPIDVVATATGSICDSSKLSDTEIFDLESTAISYIKRPRIEVNQTLLEEITAINYQLIDTVLDISDEDTPSTVVSAQFRGGQGTIVRCSFIAVSISPNLKSQQFPIQPLRLLVPANYPLCSPIFLDKLRVEVSDELEDLSEKVKSKLNMSLRRLTEPLSLGEIARTWDVCARAVISEYAQQNGGGNLSSKYREWEDCLNAS